MRAIVIVAIVVAALSIVAKADSEDAILTFRYKNLYPEGMDWDANHDRFIVGSMDKPSLFTLSPSSGVLNVFVKDSELKTNMSIGVVGVRVDRPRNRVLAVFSSFLRSNGGQPFQALVGYDLDTKSRVLFTRLDIVSSSDQKPQGNDVAVDSQGNSYVTNSANNFIWKVTPSGKATIFTEDPLFSSQPVVTASDDLATPCGLNGLVYHQRGNFLLVVQSNSGALFRVNLETAKVELVMSKALPGADGVFFRKDGKLVVISNSTAWLLDSTHGWRSAYVDDELEIGDPECFPTAVTVRKGFKLHILCSHLPEFLQGKSRNEFSIRHVEFPGDLKTAFWSILVICMFMLLILAWRFHMTYFFRTTELFRSKKRN